MIYLYPKSAQFPVGIVAGFALVGTGGFLFNGDGWVALACFTIGCCACVASAILTMREG